MSVSYDKCEIHDEVENLICFDQGCEYFNKLSCKVCHNSQPHIAREVEVFYKEWAQLFDKTRKEFTKSLDKLKTQNKEEQLFIDQLLNKLVNINQNIDDLYNSQETEIRKLLVPYQEINEELKKIRQNKINPERFVTNELAQKYIDVLKQKEIDKIIQQTGNPFQVQIIENIKKVHQANQAYSADFKYILSHVEIEDTYNQINEQKKLINTLVHTINALFDKPIEIEKGKEQPKIKLENYDNYDNMLLENLEQVLHLKSDLDNNNNELFAIQQGLESKIQQKQETSEDQVMNELNKRIKDQNQVILKYQEEILYLSKQNKYDNNNEGVKQQDYKKLFENKSTECQNLAIEKSKISDHFLFLQKENHNLEMMNQQKQEEIDNLTNQIAGFANNQIQQDKMQDDGLKTPKMSLQQQLINYQHEIQNKSNYIKQKQAQYEFQIKSLEKQIQEFKNTIQEKQIIINQYQIAMDKAEKQSIFLKDDVNRLHSLIDEKQNIIESSKKNKNKLNQLIQRNLQEIQEFSQLLLTNKGVTPNEQNITQNSSGKEQNFSRLRNRSLYIDTQQQSQTISFLPNIKDQQQSAPITQIGFKKTMFGIFKNYPINFNYKSKKVYEKPFYHKTTFEELLQVRSMCTQNNFICVGVYHRLKPQKLLLCAIDSGISALQETYALNQAMHGHAVYWYFVRSKAFGFSNNENISLDSIDALEGDQRMSWALNQSGGRIGSLEDKGLDYFKVIYLIQK